MNPTGDDVCRRSLLAKKIFMSLILLQILSNSGLAFACFFLKAARSGFLFCELSSLSRHQRKKSPFSDEDEKSRSRFLRNG